MSSMKLPYDLEDADFSDDPACEDAWESDRKVIAEMIEAGVDLSRARHTVHFLYLPTEEVARQAAQALARNGYLASVRPRSAIGTMHRWPLIAEKVEVINLANMDSDRNFLNAVAEFNAGTYDGWEAELD